MSSRKLIRKADLEPAFIAARSAGFAEIKVSIETREGLVIHVTARHLSDRHEPSRSPLEIWKMNRDAS